MTNTYSPTWFDTFLETRSHTREEVAFIVRNLPNPPFGRVLDLCCGRGRLSGPLAAAGYALVGVDLDKAALEAARQSATNGAVYLRLDMRDTREIPGRFDAVLCWWQSFGYFDGPTNLSVLEQISGKLREGGRLLLDIYQREYWEAHQGERLLERKGITIRCVDEVSDGRLTSRLEYPDGLGSDSFEWQLYSLEGISRLARDAGLRLALACSGWDEDERVTGKEPSMQLVFERVGEGLDHG